MGQQQREVSPCPQAGIPGLFLIIHPSSPGTKVLGIYAMSSFTGKQNVRAGEKNPSTGSQAVILKVGRGVMGGDGRVGGPSSNHRTTSGDTGVGSK